MFGVFHRFLCHQPAMHLIFFLSDEGLGPYFRREEDQHGEEFQTAGQHVEG